MWDVRAQRLGGRVPRLLMQNPVRGKRTDGWVEWLERGP
jgi:hypothetical protein